jgi:ElaB/YqjD/DUF883 family membrane-anchored ribosome-binding protein|tara:strand:+ start:2383 stop:2784 length:402 start_codon:yes stop_codon:yes gene_type:complete
MSDQLQKLVEDVAVLKEQNAVSSDIHDRLDSAIDKLTDIQSGIKSMLAVHEERIVRAEESDVEIQSIMENRQETIREDIQTLHKRITDETKDMRQYFNDKLHQLEKTKWIMVGVACALGISFTPMANMLTSVM